VAFAVGVAGCGGSKSDYQEVPGPPVEMAIPSETVEADGNSGANAGATPTPTATDSGSDSGGATAPAQEDSATNDTAPPAGSEAQQFEDFCAQNPGAC
jgi:hypothetical protein